MEKFKHEQYRDQLAKDLKGVENHEERASALESEKEGWRYKLAKERHTTDLAALHEEKRLEGAKKEILKELDERPVEELIQSHPELAEKIESIRLKKDGQEISLVRDKTTPEMAFPVWSKSKHRGGTMGKIYLNVPESRLPEGEVNMEFRSVCACCGTETYGLKSPFQTQHPKYPEYKKQEGESENAFRTRHDREAKQYEEDLKIWKESEEGKKDAEWHEEKKQEYKQAMQDACTENGIKYVAMRKGAKLWSERYGAIEGVEMMEMADTEEVRQKMNELKASAGKEKGNFSFEISD